MSQHTNTAHVREIDEDLSNTPLLRCTANGGHSFYTVTFDGTHACIDEQAAAYIERMSMRASFEVIDPAAEIWASLPRTVEALDPTCEHELGQRLCYGPDHYPSREQEMAWGIG